MKKEYEIILTRINNQIKEMEEKLVKLKKEYQEKCEEYNDIYSTRCIIVEEWRDINNEIDELRKKLLLKEYKKHELFSYMIYGTGIAAALGIIEGSAIIGSAVPADAAFITLMSSVGIGLSSQAIGEFKNNGKSKKVNREVSDNKEMIELNKKKDDKEKELEEINEKVDRISKEKESTYLEQNNCINNLNLMELFKLELIYLVNSGNTNSIEESKEKKLYEKPMMRIRKKED